MAGSFLDGLVGTASGSPSTAFNYGAAAANNKYPATTGYSTQDAATISAVIASQKAEADRAYTEGKRQADNNYKVALMNAHTAQDVQKANADYQEAQSQLARDRLEFDKQTQAQEFGLKQQQFGLDQAKVGYDVLNTAANLRGPQNYFQAADYARGVASNPNSSTFLGALKDQTRLAGFGAQYGVPDKATVGSLSDTLGGGSGLSANGGNVIDGTVLSASSQPATGTTSTGDDTRLNNIRAIYARGAHQLGNGALENLTDTERKLLFSGIDEIGGDSATFLDQYKRSRVGQNLSANRAA